MSDRSERLRLLKQKYGVQESQPTTTPDAFEQGVNLQKVVTGVSNLMELAEYNNNRIKELRKEYDSYEQQQPQMMAEATVGGELPFIGGAIQNALRVALAPIAKENIAQKAGDIALGTVGLGISLIPQIALLNMGTPFAKTVTRPLGKIVGVDEEITDAVTDIALSRSLGKKIMYGFGGATVGGKVGEKLLEQTNLSEKNKQLGSELSGYLGFGLGMKLGGKTPPKVETSKVEVPKEEVKTEVPKETPPEAPVVTPPPVTPKSPLNAFEQNLIKKTFGSKFEDLSEQEQIKILDIKKNSKTYKEFKDNLIPKDAIQEQNVQSLPKEEKIEQSKPEVAKTDENVQSSPKPTDIEQVKDVKTEVSTPTETTPKVEKQAETPEPKQPFAKKVKFQEPLKTPKGTVTDRIAQLRKEALDSMNNNPSLLGGGDVFIKSVQLGVEHFKNGAKTFAEFSKRMIEDLGEKIKPHLLKIWQGMKEELAKGVMKIAESPFVPKTTMEMIGGDSFQSRFKGLQRVAQKVEDGKLDLPEETILRVAERKLIDALNRGKMVIREAEKVMPVDDALNFKLKADLYSGKAKTRIDNLTEWATNKTDGFLKRLTDDKFSMDDLGEYLLARHAKERNAYIEKKNSKKNGSGITDKEAGDIISKWQGKGIDKYADEFKKDIIDKTRKELLDGGILTQEKYDLLKNQYQWYVPLKGTKELIQFYGTGKGFSVSSTGILKARGRGSVSDNPFIRMMLDATKSIVAIEKNKVGRSFHDFAKMYPSDAWSISSKKPMQQVKNNQLSVFVDGKQKLITIHDTPLLRGLKNLGVERGYAVLQKANSYLRAVTTYYSPSFIFTNLSRDAQTALINIAGEKGLGIMKDVAKDVPSMMKDIWTGVRDKGQTKWFDEYRKYGGKMSWLEYKTPEQLTKDFGNEIAKYKHKGKLKNGLVATEKFIGDINDVIENSFRVSAFKNLVERGVPKERAAIFAKELTVNFNAKGEWGQALNSAYLFWNAGMQGSVRILKALKHPRTQKIATGLIGVSALMNYINRNVDEDGYNKISDWEKDSNWIMMLGGGKYLKIRLPYGYNVFNVIGGAVADFTMGKKEFGQTTGRIINATVDAFNPFGQAGSVSQFFAPTILDPIIQLAENKKFSGAPIRKEQPAYQPKKPDSQLYFESVRPTSKAFTDWMNKLTGGNEIESGTIDINPENVDFLIDFIGGGSGKFINNTITTGTELLTKGDFPDIKNIPIAREFIGEGGKTQTKNIIYEMYEESGRKKFSKEESQKFLKYVRDAVRDGEINAKEGTRLLHAFQKGQFKIGLNNRSKK